MNGKLTFSLIARKVAHFRLPRSLALSMLSQHAKKPQLHQTNAVKNSEPQITPEIQSSIKEVTSAIVHHFDDHNNPAHSGNSRSRSVSPSSR